MLYKRTKQISFIAIGCMLTAVVIIAICNYIVANNAKGRTFDNLADVPSREIGLLLGTSPITPDGVHNYYLSLIHI